MQLEDLQWGLKAISIGSRLLVAALIGVMIAPMLPLNSNILAVVLFLLLLDAIIGALAIFMGAINLRKMNRNYHTAFWALMLSIVLSVVTGQEIASFREVIRSAMVAGFAVHIVYGTNEVLEKRTFDELVRWGQWTIRWEVAVVVITGLCAFFADTGEHLRAICLIVGALLSVICLICYIGYLGDASKEISSWESLALPEENVSQ